MNYSTKLSRRKLLLLLGGSLLAATTISLPSEAAKKGKRTRSEPYYPRNRHRNYDDSTPSPTPSPTPAAPEPYRATSPVVMFGVGGGLLGGFGFLGAWLIKMNQKSTSPTPSPVERRVVKPAKQAAPEIADWYVFRSGKPEGPYTTLQLWEVQKITDRTKVRRGEADWQKAGEVPELAKYLSKK
ncbi:MULTISPECIES: DUF4339 domain-containing protein [unclassified Microcoleus]|uniref:DUF4339 domain-containing protein n=1 Tax=unclassified Microcoleus TaxID=2642155 RepID=UPI002FD66355